MKLKMFCALVCVALLLAGCNGQPAVQEAEPCPTCPPMKVCPECVECGPAMPGPIGERDTFYFLAGNNRDPFYVPGVKGLMDAAAAVNMKAEFVGPMDANLAEHIAIFEQLNASSNTAGIMLYAWDPDAQAPLIQEAVDKGIPLVIGAADSPLKIRDAFVGYDNTILGQQAGAWIADLLGGHGVVGSVGINGYNVTERQEGMKSYLEANYPGITVIERTSHDGSAESGIKTLDAYLIANPDLDLLWWADGLAGQMAQPWKERQEAGAKTLFLGTDMPNATLQAVKDGVFVGSVGQDTYTEAYWCILALNELRLGRRVPDSLYLSALLVDQGNVDLYLE